MHQLSYELVRLRLHDPTRTPPEWAGHLSPSQYAVFLADAKMGFELAIDGKPKPQLVPGECLVFDCLSAAEAFCDGFVKLVPTARCDVYDHRGKSRTPVSSFTHARHTGSVPNRRTARRMMALAAALIIPTPVLFWIDWRMRGVLIVPTLLGLSLLAAAFRLLLWAFGTLDAVRTTERRRAALNS